MSNLDIEISKTDLNILKSEQYPTLSIGISTERSKNLNDDNTESTYVGDNSVSGSSAYKGYSSVSLNYNLFDFGRISSKLESQQFDIKVKQSEYCANVTNIFQKLLNAYYDTKISQIKKQYLTEVLKQSNKIYTYKKRLNSIGNIQKTDLVSNAIQIANLYSDISNNEKEFIEKLENLSNISQYNLTEIDNLDPLVFSKNILDKKFEDTNISKKILDEINIKKSEINLIKAEYFPTISLFGKYDIYGSNTDNFGDAFDDMKENSYKYGLNISWQIFNGFKVISQEKKAFQELKKLSLNYEKSKQDFQSELNSLNKTYKFNKKVIEENNKALNFSDEKIDMNSRLNEIGEINKTVEIESIIKKLYVELDLKKAQEEMSYKLIKKDIFLNGDATCIVR